LKGRALATLEVHRVLLSENGDLHGDF
jgi:hypothetical protein